MKSIFTWLLISSLFWVGCSKTETETPPSPQTANYDPEVKAVMTNYCITCHSGITASAGLSLNNYNTVRFSTEYGDLLNRINSSSSPMPPSGLMPSAQRQILDTWAKNGYPE
jgi:cytochrome c5